MRCSLGPPPALRATLAGMPAPKSRKSPPNRSAATQPEPAPQVAREVVRTEEALAAAIREASFLATMYGGTGADWISSTEQIMQAIDRAIYGIRCAGQQPINGPMPDAAVSEAFLFALCNLSQDFLAKNAYQHRSRYNKTQKKLFREALISYTTSLSQPFYVENWGRSNYESIAQFLSTGTSIFPDLGKCDYRTLVARLSRLGPGFLKTTPDPHDRAHEILKAAGVKGAWTYIFDADRKKTARAPGGP